MKPVYQKVISAATDGKIKFAPKRARFISQINKQEDLFRGRFFPNIFEQVTVPKRNPNISTINKAGNNHIQERFLFDSIG